MIIFLRPWEALGGPETPRGIGEYPQPSTPIIGPSDAATRGLRHCALPPAQLAPDRRQAVSPQRARPSRSAATGDPDTLAI